MKHLINREDYICEYLRVSKEIEKENELDEGLLSTVFGGLKMLLKKDWANVKCKNPSVLAYLKDIDKSLGGFTMTKMQFSGECQTIRQNVADYFSDILNYKLKDLENYFKDSKDVNKTVDNYLKNEAKEKKANKDAKGVIKHLNIKDENVINSIEKYKENIDIACKSSPKLKDYATLMLNSVEVFVNDVIISELEKKGVDKEKLEKKIQKNKEEDEKLKEVRDRMSKAVGQEDKEALKKISEERDEALKELGIKPMGNMNGDKSIDVIVKQFKGIISEFNINKLNESKLPGDYDKKLKGDTYIGIIQTLEELEWESSQNSKLEPVDKFFIKVILNKINTVFGVIARNKKYFETVPSQSVQSMMVSLSNAIIYGFMGEDKFDIKNDKYRLPLMTKCAIDSDATIGFNLPILDDKPENGNFFVRIMHEFKDTKISSEEVKNVVNNTLSDKEKIATLKAMKLYKKGLTDKEIISKFDEWGKDKMKEFRQNMTELFDFIVKEAKRLKEEAEAART